jgi:hypothetical protein
MRSLIVLAFLLAVTCVASAASNEKKAAHASVVATVAGQREFNFAPELGKGNASVRVGTRHLMNQYYPTSCTNNVDSYDNSDSRTISAQGSLTLTYDSVNRMKVRGSLLVILNSNM